MTHSQPPGTADRALRFAVVDTEDLAVLSAHVQDSLLSLSDVTYLAKPQRFALVVSRIDWHAIAEGRQERRHTGFHFERVLRVQRTGFRAEDEDRSLQLLAVEFRPGEAPAGDVILTFAGGPAIKLEVECLEAELHDLGACFSVSDCPSHWLDEADQAR